MGVNKMDGLLVKIQESAKELIAEQKRQAVILDSVMSNVESLMSDIDTIRGAIK